MLLEKLVEVVWGTICRDMFCESGSAFVGRTENDGHQRDAHHQEAIPLDQIRNVILAAQNSHPGR